MNAINWQEHELLPAIVQDFDSGEVLMLAYQNRQAYELTLQSGYAHYYSRSRKRLWKKGESSGHTQEVKKIKIDCDADTILLQIKQNGVACHTGAKTCFFTDITEQKSDAAVMDPASIYGVIDTLYHTLQQRKKADPKSSYTAKLMQGGENTILKKVAEEAAELCFAVKDGNNDEIIYEAADLVYHSLVALAYKNVNPDRVKQELARRFGMSGIEEKNSRKQ